MVLRALVVILAFPVVCLAQDPDPQLMAYIDSIRAIDNHAHVVAPDVDRDKDFDALRCDTLPSTAPLPPANTRFGPDLQAAWKALYGITADSTSADNLASWQAAQKTTRERLGASYFDWVIQQAGLDVVLANRVTMARELGSAHFRWVPYDDALLFPLSNATQKAENPDRSGLYGAEEQHLAHYLSALGLRVLPPTLDGYLREVVTPTVESQKKRGAVAIKFEVAYLRSLDFGPAAAETAADVYKTFIGRGTPGRSEYTRLQDFLFRYIAGEAGRLGLVMHIHTGSGCGEYFDDRGADPMLLDSVLNDPALRKTRFVLLHGGVPFDRHNTALIVKPNVWVDTSVLTLIYSAGEVARIVSPWLDMMPEHVIFGTDAGPFGVGMGWEESTWIASRKSRRALGLALTQLIRDGAITPVRARAIADGVLRENAAALYGWN
jgi:predicted TIM-barrel fold metal-dependent hydrolase